MTWFKTTRGFTLIEILIALAVIAILVVIGTVYYSQYIEKTKGVEASIALAEIVRLEQLYYAQTGTYSTDLISSDFS